MVYFISVLNPCLCFCRHCPYFLEAISALAELGASAKEIISLLPQVYFWKHYYLFSILYLRLMVWHFDVCEKLMVVMITVSTVFLLQLQVQLMFSKDLLLAILVVVLHAA